MGGYHHYPIIYLANLSDVLPTNARCRAAALAMPRVVDDEIETVPDPCLSARLQDLQAPVVYSPRVPRCVMNEVMQAVVIAVDQTLGNCQNVLSLSIAKDSGKVMPEVLPLGLPAKDIVKL